MALAAFSCSAFIPAAACAQAANTQSATAHAAAPKTLPTMEGALMIKAGKTWVYSSGKWTPATQNMTMPNGSVVNLKGVVTMKDGSKVTLKDGDKIMADGTINQKK